MTLQKAGGLGQRAPAVAGEGLAPPADEDGDGMSSDGEEDDGGAGGGPGRRRRRIFYWREWLEKFLDSLWVTAVILLLLLLDVSMFFATTVSGVEAGGGGAAMGWGPEDVITVVVTATSLVDVSLRQVAKQICACLLALQSNTACMHG